MIDDFNFWGMIYTKKKCVIELFPGDVINCTNLYGYTQPTYKSILSRINNIGIVLSIIIDENSPVDDWYCILSEDKIIYVPTSLITVKNVSLIT